MARHDPWGVPRPANGFFYMTVLFGMLFVLTAGAAASAIMPAFSAPDPASGAGELVLMDTETGKVKDMKKTVPNEDVDRFRMDINDGIATWYSNGEFRSYDINAKSMKDNYAPANNYDPENDPFTSNGQHMAFYSSWTNTIVVRETAPMDGSEPSDVKVIENGATLGETRLMTADGHDLYWVGTDLTDGNSVVYKYNTGTEVTTEVLRTEQRIEDMDTCNGKVAYQFGEVMEHRRHSQVVGTEVHVYDTATGEDRTHCSDCHLPALGGSLIAVRTQNGIMVSDMDTGGNKYIEENDDVLDVETDGDKVAWSWVPPYQTDPITVRDMKTGDERVYAPDKLIFGFAMDHDNILMLQSKIPIADVNGPDPAALTALMLSPLFLLGTLVLGVVTVGLEMRRKGYMDRAKRWYQWQQYYATYGYPAYSGGYYNYGYGYQYHPYYQSTYNYSGQGSVSNYTADGTPRYY